MHSANAKRFSLITFNETYPAPVKRQAAAPQVYNVTRSYSAASGVNYVFTAYAVESQNGNTAPQCSIAICAQDACGNPSSLTPSYSAYSYSYTARISDDNAVATFTVQCAQAAYVAIDDITISSSGSSNQAGEVTRTVTQYVTQTPSPVIQTQAPVTATTVQYSTEVSTVEIPNTLWRTVSGLSTTTSELSWWWRDDEILIDF